MVSLRQQQITCLRYMFLNTFFNDTKTQAARTAKVILSKSHTVKISPTVQHDVRVINRGC